MVTKAPETVPALAGRLTGLLSTLPDSPVGPTLGISCERPIRSTLVSFVLVRDPGGAVPEPGGSTGAS